MKLAAFSISPNGSTPWGSTCFYEPGSIGDGERLRFQVNVSASSPTKLVVFAFSGPREGGLERVCVKYLKPAPLKSALTKIKISFRGCFLDIILNGPPQKDITADVRRVLAEEDIHARQLLKSMISRQTKRKWSSQNLAPLAHWMRCFSLEQPINVSPVMLSGLPMALCLDPELIHEALPRAFEVVLAIAPRLKRARTKPEIGLCLMMLLRVFSGQYATERDDDRSLIKGMLAVNAGWDCDDMSLMSLAVLKAMRHIKGSPLCDTLKSVLHYARREIKEAFVIHGLAFTPQKTKEGHVWLGLASEPLVEKRRLACGARVFELSSSFKFGEATCFSALDASQYDVAKMPPAFDIESAMRENRHKNLSPFGECGVNAPICGDRYTAVQIIGPEKTYVARTANQDGSFSLGATPEAIADPLTVTELIEVSYSPLPENAELSKLVRGTIIGYGADLFQPGKNRYLESCINLTKPEAGSAEINLLPGTIDAPWQNFAEQPESQTVCSAVQWCLRSRGRGLFHDACDLHAGISNH